jgi:hypothetical protein
MAFPLILGGIAKTVIGGISFTQPSEKRAAAVVPGVVNSALSGNLVAIQVLESRTTYGIPKEKAVWQGGYNQVAQARPDLIAAYQQRKSQLPPIPNSATTGPEAAASYATSNVITKDSPFSGATGGGSSTATAGPQGTVGTKTKWVLGAFIIVGAGLVVLGLVKKKGR